METNSRAGPARTPNTLQIPPDRTPGRTGPDTAHATPHRRARREPNRGPGSAAARCRETGVIGYDIILYITKRYIDTDCRLLVLVLGVAAERFAEATALLLLLGRGEA